MCCGSLSANLLPWSDPSFLVAGLLNAIISGLWIIRHTLSFKWGVPGSGLAVHRVCLPRRKQPGIFLPRPVCVRPGMDCLSKCYLLSFLLLICLETGFRCARYYIQDEVQIYIHHRQLRGMEISFPPSHPICHCKHWETPRMSKVKLSFWISIPLLAFVMTFI